MAPESYRRSTNQSQSHRRAPAGEQKRAITPEERRRREALRREKARQAAEEAKERRAMRRARRKKLFLVSFALAVFFVAVYWCWVAIDIANRKDGSESALPLLLFTEGNRKEDKSLTVEEVTFGGKTFLPVTALEDYMVISQFGDYQTRSFLLCESGEYATFYLGTCNAVINGVPVSLKDEAFLKDDTLYLPVDFFTDKMNCFTFATSTPLAANVLTFQESVTPAFSFAASQPSSTVDPATIPVAPVVPPEGTPAA